jgi:hypothetical protein
MRSPNAARSIWLALWVAAALTLGSSALSSFHRCPRAASTLSVLIRAPRLFLKARSSASLKESGNTSLVALPSGTLLVNGLCPVGAEGKEKLYEETLPLELLPEDVTDDVSFTLCAWQRLDSVKQMRMAAIHSSAFSTLGVICRRFHARGTQRYEG